MAAPGGFQQQPWSQMPGMPHNPGFVQAGMMPNQTQSKPPNLQHPGPPQPTVNGHYQSGNTSYMNGPSNPPNLPGMPPSNIPNTLNQSYQPSTPPNTSLNSSYGQIPQPTHPSIQSSMGPRPTPPGPTPTSMLQGPPQPYHVPQQTTLNNPTSLSSSASSAFSPLKPASSAPQFPSVPQTGPQPTRPAAPTSSFPQPPPIPQVPQSQAYPQAMNGPSPTIPSHSAPYSHPQPPAPSFQAPGQHPAPSFQPPTLPNAPSSVPSSLASMPQIPGVPSMPQPPQPQQPSFPHTSSSMMNGYPQPGPPGPPAPPNSMASPPTFAPQGPPQPGFPQSSAPNPAGPYPGVMPGSPSHGGYMQQPQQMQGQPGGYPVPNPYGGGYGQQQQQDRYVDLKMERNLMGYGLEDNEINLPGTVCNPNVNMNPSVFRCTMSAIPQTQELQKKCRLPLGLTLHPFKDLKNLSVVQTNIVRCRYCRTYINPYVYLPDNRHWKCNICYRSNDLPDEFCWDPSTKSYGDPTRRPELHHPTIEYIASSEYMLRPPQPAMYFFILDVSANAIENGYLHTFSEQLLINLDQLPGDDRTLIGFMACDAMVHFFQFTDPKKPPKHLIIDDVDDMFIPTNSGFCVELVHFRESVRSFIQNLPTFLEANACTSNCVGAAIDVAHKLIAEVGGRITVFQTVLPDVGPGALKNRSEKPDLKNLVTATDYYKRIALECTGHQVAVDLFVLSNSYVDLATLSEISKFSSGSVYYYPNYHINRGQLQVKRFQKHFNRYLTRKIGFEAVLRIRCSRGVSLHTFHGNFFVRSTDLLAMANVNPDSAIGVQVQLEENLTGQNTVCFQAALLYTSSKGDRRIRVHTLCLPVTADYSTIFNLFDIKASVSLLAKMASERAMTGGDITDSREGLINAAIDAMGAYNRSVGQRSSVVLAPTLGGLKMLPLYVLGLLKHRAFSASPQAQKRLDERLAAMLQFKNAALEVIMLEVHPALYAVHNMDQCEENPQRLPLSYERVNRDGVYLLDTGNYAYLYVCSGAQPEILQNLFNVSHFGQLDEDTVVEQRENTLSERLHSFLRTLQTQRGQYAPIVVLRDDSPLRDQFTQRLIEDRTEQAHSYIEFVNHLSQEIQR